MRPDTSRRKVGLVIGQLTYGGAEGQLYELARGLARFARPHVYCLSQATEPYGTLLREAGVPLRVLPSRGSFDVSRVLGLSRALREDGIEVAHAFLFLASAYTYLATRRPGSAAFVASARNCKPEPNPLRRWLVRAAFRGAARVICNSNEVARYAQTHYSAAPERSRVILNGVDTSRFDLPRRPHAGLRIGTVGRIEKQKNLDVFLKAASRVRRERPDAVFEVVGDGSLRSHYESEVRRLGLADAVTLPGTRRDVPEFYAGLDQFWLTSDWEGTPNVVLEALAAGVPVVATRVGGTPEVVEDGVTGILVGAGDAGAVAAASLALAGDPARSRAMGTAAADSARRRFSLGAMVEATASVYEEALR